LQPLWAALAILIAGILFDVFISIFLGASALPVNIIIGTLFTLPFFPLFLFAPKQHRRERELEEMGW